MSTGDKISIRVTKSLKRDMKRLARKDKRTLSAYIKNMLKKHISFMKLEENYNDK